MGHQISLGPVVEKDTERDHNDRFNVAVSSCQGWRGSQEDNHSLILNLPNPPGGSITDAAFFAVFDGHGSATVSKYASECLWKHLIKSDAYAGKDYAEGLREAFLNFDNEVKVNCDAQLAGTTAVCTLIVDNFIYCANIGDSRAVACIDCTCVPLSQDHKPDNPVELERIMAAGGYVVGNRVNGNLALSRAFGDFYYKRNEQLPAEEQIVSPYPEIEELELNDDVDFILLACDGIWDVLSSEEVVEFVISRLEDNMEPGLICEQLTTRCIAADYELVIGCDNMTVMLVCYLRGRSWNDYCTDIFNKNSARLGLTDRPRFKQKPSETPTTTDVTTNSDITQNPFRVDNCPSADGLDNQNESDPTQGLITDDQPQLTEGVSEFEAAKGSVLEEIGETDTKNQQDPLRHETKEIEHKTENMCVAQGSGQENVQEDAKLEEERNSEGRQNLEESDVFNQDQDGELQEELSLNPIQLVDTDAPPQNEGDKEAENTVTVSDQCHGEVHEDVHGSDKSDQDSKPEEDATDFCEPQGDNVDTNDD